MDRTAGGRLKVRPHIAWRDKAVVLIKCVAKGAVGRPFSARELIWYAHCMRFQPPPDKRAWGPALVQAQADGIIKRAGTTSDRFYRKGAKVALWQAA